MYDKSKGTESCISAKYHLNGYYFLTVLPRVVCKTQPKVYGGDFFEK